MTESQLNTINYLTEAEYEAAKEANNINENELYITSDSESENVFSICKLESSTNQTFSTTGGVYTNWIESFKNGDYQFDSGKKL